MADAATTDAGTTGDGARWRILGLVCAGVVLSMTTWFSATAITPELVRAFGLSTGEASWLTNSVQVGFGIGALASSLVGLPDRVSLRRLMAASAALAALANLALLAAPSVGALLLARAATGMALAGLYPPALKLVATWFRRGRGTALGAVIAALTLGSAFPHLVRAATDHVAWQAVVASASGATLAGGALLGRFGVEGPFPFGRAPFDVRQIGAVLSNRPLMLANLGYFGHMWELYAMWGWFLAFAAVALPRLGLSGPEAASLLTFAVVASGVVGALGGGLLADRIGRTAAAGLMMAASGSCALLICLAFDGPPWLFVLVALVWGITIIGDSAQFSAMATELSDSHTVGTALALQLGLGFALTVVSIRLTPVVAEAVGWRWTFLMLVPGPAVGVIAMAALRRRPEALRIAGGLR